jgi:toxin ParE1/3/4
MNRLIWTPEAISDLQDIWSYIADDNPIAATNTIAHIETAALSLMQFPKLGRPGRRDRIRHLNVAGTPYFIAYRLAKSEIAIARVIHGARDWPRKRKRP